MLVLSFGSNIGDRLQNLRSGLLLVLKKLGSINYEVSNIYESKALLPSGAPSDWNIDFLNFCAVINTKQNIWSIIKILSDVELALGREKLGFWSPRIIDIDILFYGSAVYYSHEYSIPHLEMHKRDFILRPLCDILPNFMHPKLLLKTSDLLKNLQTSDESNIWMDADLFQDVHLKIEA